MIDNVKLLSENPDGTVVCSDGFSRPPWAAANPLLREYYDTEWGVPVRDERGVFERISLEAFQAGLSWATILHKREAFRAAFHGFEPDRVASMDATDVEQLLANPDIVRNRAKIEATIDNARATIALREHGGLARLVWSFQPTKQPQPQTLADIPTQSPESAALATALRKAGFRFVGPVTMFALMEAIGIIDTHLPHSHRTGQN
ncbi:MAG: DNA-3-methyladenine glycosylase I [Microbacteriaceae bacterium]|nr:DNA-3-methyladenine glycosylase I [Microbacteriaceae bacterium]